MALVGEGVGVVGTKFGDVLEGVDAGGVLLGVEHGDAVVVPAHPFLVVLTGRAERGGFRRRLKVRSAEAISTTGFS